MMRPDRLAFIQPPTGKSPHVCVVFKRKDGSTFYGCTWREPAPFPSGWPRSAAYLVRIRMKPEALA